MGYGLQKHMISAESVTFLVAMRMAGDTAEKIPLTGLGAFCVVFPLRYSTLGPNM